MITEKDQKQKKSSHEEPFTPALPPTLLLCKPDYFDVNYIINPWMRPSQWQSSKQTLYEIAVDGWQALCETFAQLGFKIELIEAKPGLPDMVFTANSAIVLNGRALVSRFKFKERQGEEQYFSSCFNQLKETGLLTEVAHFPKGKFQEGAGDCVFDAARKIFWAGYGPRSSKESVKYISSYFNIETVPLELVTDEFYHADVSICPLSGGQVMYYPEAFSKRSQSIIKDRAGSKNIIEVAPGDAHLFALNAVNVGTTIVLADCTVELERQLNNLGYKIIRVPVGTFNLAGGSVWCLILRLDLHT